MIVLKLVEIKVQVLSNVDINLNTWWKCKWVQKHPTVSSTFQKLANQPALRGIKVNALALTFALKNWEYCGTQKVQISSLTDHFDPHWAPATFSLSPLCFQQCLPFILLCFEFPSPTLGRVNVSLALGWVLWILWEQMLLRLNCDFCCHQLQYNWRHPSLSLPILFSLLFVSRVSINVTNNGFVFTEV